MDTKVYRKSESLWDNAHRDHGASITLVKQLKELGDKADPVDLAESLRIRAIWRMLVELWEESLSDITECIAILEPLFAAGTLDDPERFSYAYNDRAHLLVDMERTEEALLDFDRTIQIREKLLKEGNLVCRKFLARTYMYRGKLHQTLGHISNAMEDYTRAIGTGEDFYSIGELGIDDIECLAATYFYRASLLDQLERQADMKPDLDRCIVLYEYVLAAEELYDLQNLTAAYYARASFCEQTQDAEGAISDYSRFIELHQDNDLEGNEDLLALVIAYYDRAMLHTRLHDNEEEVLSGLTEAIAIAERLRGRWSFSEARDGLSLSHIYFQRSLIYMKRGLFDESLKDAEQCVIIMKAAYKVGELTDSGLDNFARTLATRAEWLSTCHRDDESLEDLDLAIEIWDRLKNEDKPFHPEAFARAFNTRGRVLERRGAYMEAFRNYSESLGYYEHVERIMGSVDNMDAFASARQNRAVFMFSCECLDYALEDMNKAIDIRNHLLLAEDKESIYDAAEAYHIRSAIHHQAENYNEAVLDGMRTIELRQSLYEAGALEPYKLAAAYNNFASSELALGLYDEAVKSSSASLKICKVCPDNIDTKCMIAKNLHRCSKAYMAMGDVSRSFAYIEKAGEIVEQVGDEHKALAAAIKKTYEELELLIRQALDGIEGSFLQGKKLEYFLYRFGLGNDKNKHTKNEAARQFKISEKRAAEIERSCLRRLFLHCKRSYQRKRFLEEE